MCHEQVAWDCIWNLTSSNEMYMYTPYEVVLAHRLPEVNLLANRKLSSPFSLCHGAFVWFHSWRSANLAPQLVGPRCDYQIAETDGILMLTPTASSWHCATPVPDSGLLPTVLELCAGFGGMGIGTSFLGGEVAVSVDHNGLSISHLQRKHERTSASIGLDLSRQCQTHPSTVFQYRKLPLLDSHVSLFSSQGSQMRAHDTRICCFPTFRMECSPT